MALKDGRNFQVKEKAYAKALRREDTLRLEDRAREVKKKLEGKALF